MGSCDANSIGMRDTIIQADLERFDAFDASMGPNTFTGFDTAEGIIAIKLHDASDDSVIGIQFFGDNGLANTYIAQFVPEGSEGRGDIMPELKAMVEKRKGLETMTDTTRLLSIHHPTMSSTTNSSQTQSPPSSPTYSTLLPLLLPPSTPAPLLQPPSPLSSQHPRPTHPNLTAPISALQLHPNLEALLHILNRDLTSAHFLLRHQESPPYWEAMTIHALLHRVEGDLEGNSKAWYEDVTGSAVWVWTWVVDGKGNADVLGEMVEEAKASEEKPKDGPDVGSDAAKEKYAEQLTQIHDFLDRVGKLQKSQQKHIQRHNAASHSQSNSTDQTTSSASTNHDPGTDVEAQAWDAEYAALCAISEREVRRLLEWCERKYGTDRYEDASMEYPAKKGGKWSDMAKEQLVGGEGWRKF